LDNRRVVIPAGLMLLAALAGCSGSGSDRASGEPTTGQPQGNGSAPAGGRLVKEGWFGAAGPFHARVEIQRVERYADRSVLRFTVTSLESAPTTAPAAFGTTPADRGEFRIRLVDPVGRKMYQPAATSEGVPPDTYPPGERRELTVSYPPIPRGVDRVTVITPGTAGEFTGVPVAQGTGRPSGPAPPAAAGNPVDLYDITEGEIKETTSSGTDEEIGLRTDVLFAFNSARLSGRAKAVLDGVAGEVRSKADPAKPPIRIEGHTDSKGSDAYNLKLSRERADAVLKELRSRLGSTYEYTAQGKGETDLIAKEGGSDDAAARSRNRRVEVSYQVRQQTPGNTSTSTAPAPGRGGAAAAAPFRPQDGRTVASRFGRFGGDKRRIDVKPFYRDGAYLVAVFDIVNEGPGTTPPDASYGHKDYPGGGFTAFSVIDKTTQDVYRAVRVGPASGDGPDSYVDPGRATFRSEVNVPVRGFFYVPAPPGNATSVTFDGGPFGKVLDVPIS
jgi:outer membrane protein OmpA-like peptidoglycan-associated protein